MKGKHFPVQIRMQNPAVNNLKNPNMELSKNKVDFKQCI